MCVMYYGRSCERNETRPDVAWKQHENYRSFVRTVTVNFLMTYTVYMYIHSQVCIHVHPKRVCKKLYLHVYVCRQPENTNFNVAEDLCLTPFTNQYPLNQNYMYMQYIHCFTK